MQRKPEHRLLEDQLGILVILFSVVLPREQKSNTHNVPFWPKCQCSAQVNIFVKKNSVESSLMKKVRSNQTRTSRVQIAIKDSSKLPTTTNASNHVSEWNRVDWLADYTAPQTPYVYSPILPYSNINYFTTQNIICSDMHLQQILSSPRTNSQYMPPLQSPKQQIRQDFVQGQPNSQEFNINTINSARETNDKFVLKSTGQHSVTPRVQVSGWQSVTPRGQTGSIKLSIQSQRALPPKVVSPRQELPPKSKISRLARLSQRSLSQQNGFENNKFLTSLNQNLIAPQIEELKEVYNEEEQFDRQQYESTDSVPEAQYPLVQSNSPFEPKSDGTIKSVSFIEDARQIQVKFSETTKENPNTEHDQPPVAKPQTHPLGRHLSLYDLINSHEFKGLNVKKETQNLVLGRTVQHHAKQIERKKTFHQISNKQFTRAYQNEFAQNSKTFQRKMLQIMNGLHSGFSHKSVESPGVPIPELKSSPTLKNKRHEQGKQKEKEVKTPRLQILLTITDQNGFHSNQQLTSPPYFRVKGRRSQMKKKPKTMLIDAINKAISLNKPENKFSLLAVSGMAKQQNQSMSKTSQTLAEVEPQEVLQYTFAKVKRFYKLYIQQRFFCMQMKIARWLMQQSKQIVRPSPLIYSDHTAFRSVVHIQREVAGIEELILPKYLIRVYINHFDYVMEQTIEEEGSEEDSDQSYRKGNFQDLLEDDDEFRQTLERIKSRSKKRTQVPSRTEIPLALKGMPRRSLHGRPSVILTLDRMPKRRTGEVKLKIDLFKSDWVQFFRSNSLRLTNGNNINLENSKPVTIYIEDQRDTILKVILSNIDNGTRNWMLTNWNLEDQPQISQVIVNNQIQNEMIEFFSSTDSCSNFKRDQIVDRYSYILVGEFEDYSTFENNFNIEDILEKEEERALSNPKLRLLDLKRRYRTDRNMLNNLREKNSSREIGHTQRSSEHNSLQITQILSLSATRQQTSSRNLLGKKSQRNLNIKTVQFDQHKDIEIQPKHVQMHSFSLGHGLEKIPETNITSPKGKTSPILIVRSPGRSIVLSKGVSEPSIKPFENSLQLQEKPVFLAHHNLALRRKGISITELAFQLIQDGKINELSEFFHQNPNVPSNSTDHEGNSLLIVAAQCGFLEGVELLLQKGANVNQQNFDGDSALRKALTYGHYNVADCLVSNGANVSNQHQRKQSVG